MITDPLQRPNISFGADILTVSAVRRHLWADIVGHRPWRIYRGRLSFFVGITVLILARHVLPAHENPSSCPGCY